MQLVQTAGREPKLNSIVILSVLILFGSIGIAYAEEATIQVPFDYSGFSGTFYEFDTFYQYLVKFTGDKDKQPVTVERDPISDYLPECSDINLVYDAEFDRCITEEQLTKEAIDDYTPPVEEEELTYYEQRLILLDEKKNPTKQDLEEQSLLEKLGALCSNDTLVSQTYRQFDVPTIIFKDSEGNWTEQLVENQRIDKTTVRGNNVIQTLKLAVEECIGQPYTKKSVQYDNMIIDDEYTTYFKHQDIANNVPIWTADRVNQESNPVIKTEFDPLCEMQLPDYMKANLICEEVVYESTLPAPKHVHSDEFQKTLDDMERFKNGDESFMLDTVLEKQREKAYRQLSNQNVGGQK